MLRVLQFACVATVAMATVAFPIGARAETYLPEPTTEDLDAALDPACDRYKIENGLRRKCQVRGLKITAHPSARSERVAPSVSMPVQFAYNSAELTAEAKAVLDRLGAVLASDKYKTSRFRIVGHTDAAGPDDYNNDLSRRRAEATLAYLNARFGIQRERIAILGMGERRLLKTEAPLDGVNRRVEVVNEGDPTPGRAWNPGALGDSNAAGPPSSEGMNDKMGS